MIWLTGVSVKDFACYLVNQNGLVGREKTGLFNSTMEVYLLQASIITVAVAAVIHYFFARRLVRPLRSLAFSARQMTEGRYPPPIPVSSRDEVGQLTVDFNRLTAALQRGEKTRKQLLSDISHEIRTPLSNINGYLEDLSQGVVQGDPELYQSLYEESMRLTRLVEQLHELAVWGAKGLNKSALQEIQIKPLVQSMFQAFELEMRSKHIRCETELDEGTIPGHEDGIKQVLNNLLGNAIQYDTGGLIRITGKWATGEYQISVTNTGQPIPQDQAEHTFERFYRLDPSRQRATGGSGLGLAIVKEIVRRHGGEVALVSQGNRHTFRISLPLQGEASELEESRKPASRSEDLL
ncbi:sensor histidine kinase [Ferviditalea candida]|uniref:Signal transduction histidine-protein kinase/phosphatase MprB n=1 Tax=Ferviditalea candida TaxID=3108399 RepID=A0ABU5ZIX3_9BACL|nr:ATP-binding protein [Paenibacillaceae bacterium T2]